MAVLKHGLKLLPGLVLVGLLGGSPPAVAQDYVVGGDIMSEAPTGTVRTRVGRGVGMPAAAEQRGNLGGGLIELLVTGRDPTPPRGGGYNVPPTYRAAPAGASLDREGIDNGYGRIEPQPYRRLAAFPRQPAAEPGPIARVIDPRYERQIVDYDGRHAPGTIVIDTPNRFLYLVQPGGKAVRYGIGVGRPGFEWAGVKTVSLKREWPDWRPPAQMLKRRPDLPRYMKGGPDNPLGARALYLGSSLYRIHGTNEPHTIGQNVSSGCIRMTNENVIDLSGRVSVGAKVVVM